MKNQTKTQNQTASTLVVPSHEILKGLNKYTKRKTKSAKLTIMIKQQKEYILSLTNQKEKHLAVLQYLEIISAKQRFLPVSQRLTTLPTAESVLTDVLNANPSLGGKVIKEEPKLTKVDTYQKVSKERSPLGFLTLSKRVQPKDKREGDSKNLKPQAKPATKVETKQTKQDDTLVNLTKSIADLAKSVSDLTAIVTANSNAIAELQKTKSPAPKAESKPKAQPKPKAETKPTAKAEPKKKDTVLKDFSALADFSFLNLERKSTTVDPQAKLMEQYFSFA